MVGLNTYICHLLYCVSIVTSGKWKKNSSEEVIPNQKYVQYCIVNHDCDIIPFGIKWGKQSLYWNLDIASWWYYIGGQYFVSNKTETALPNLKPLIRCQRMTVSGYGSRIYCQRHGAVRCQEMTCVKTAWIQTLNSICEYQCGHQGQSVSHTPCIHCCGENWLYRHKPLLMISGP